MPAMCHRAPSRRLLSLPELVQLAFESDEYSDTVEDSSGEEYKPGKDQVVETKPLRDVGKHNTTLCQ